MTNPVARVRNDLANNLATWYPLLVACEVPTPRTKILRAPAGLIDLLDGRPPADYKEFLARLARAASEVGGWPIFLRTGHGSGKHYWNKTCFVPKPDDLNAHVRELVEWSECVDLVGLPVDTWAVREFLILDTHFTAFSGDMPIAIEVRVFVGQGTVRCWHPYWPEEAFDDYVPAPLEIGPLLEAMNKVAEADAPIFLAMATKIARLFGEWSVDFCRLKSGEWSVTDMATAADSYHWPSCPNAPESER
jgi:hypothetical protein